MATQFTLPSRTSPSVLAMDYFRGIDLYNASTNVHTSRSPEAPNMIRDEVGKVRKRMGWATQARFGAQINGVFELNGVRIVHAGTILYAAGAGTDIAEAPQVEGYHPIRVGMNDQRSRAVQMGGKLYLLDGKNYLVYDGTPSAPTYQYQYSDLKDLWNQSGYNELLESQKKALDAYIQQQTNSLESQKTSVNQSAEQAAQEAYISYMQSKRAMPQALAASGYSGGMADSQALALESGYQDNVNDILLNRDNTLNDIDTAINNAKLEGSIQAAQAQTELGRDALSAWQSYINQQNAYANSDFWTKYGYDFQAGQNQLDRDFQADQTQKGYDFTAGQNQLDRDFQANQSQLDRDFQADQSQLDRDFQANQTQQGYDFQAGQNQLDRDFSANQTQQGYEYETAATDKDYAWNLILNGIMPDSSLLATAGISEAAASAYVAKVQSQLAASASTKSTGTTNGQDYQQQEAQTSQYDTILATAKNRIQSLAHTDSTDTLTKWAAGYLEKQLENGAISEDEYRALATELGEMIDSLSTAGSKNTTSTAGSAGVGDAGSSRDPIVEIMR